MRGALAHPDLERAVGTALLGVALLAVTLGAALWPQSPTRTLEPAVAGLAPPGTRLATLALADGRTLAAQRIERDGERYRLFDRGGERTVPGSEVGPGDPVGERRFWLGSDRFGRDLAARLLHGGRGSLAVAVASVALALGLGVPCGLAAGLARGATGSLFLVLFDAAQAFPRLFLVVALAAVVPPSITGPILILGFTGWMPIARIVRAETRRLAGTEFVAAARAAGLSRLQIAFRHLLPNLWAPIGVEASLATASAVAAEAALSFLGLGLPPPAPSWGGLIAEGRDLLAVAPWISVAPGCALALTVLGANLLAEGSRHRFDPRFAASASDGAHRAEASASPTALSGPG
jgi:peptide/nickel transport system permease protein